MINQLYLDNYINFIKKHFNNEYNKKIHNNEHINKILKNEKMNIGNDDFSIKINLGKNIALIFDLDENNEIKNYYLEYNNDKFKLTYYGGEYIHIIYDRVYEIKLKIKDETIELIDNIIQNEEYRGKGIGSEGMKKLFDFLHNAGYMKIYGKMVGDLKILKIFYSKNGFIINDVNIEHIF